MDREQLIWVVSGGIFAAIALGWLLHWIYAILARPHRNERSSAELTTRLHETEEALVETRKRADEREQDLNYKITQLKAEAAAAMEGLAEARLQTERLLSELQRRD